MTERGRPTKLTYEIIKRITDIVRAGNYLETAAAHAGIDKTTLHRWMKRGAREEERVEKESDLEMDPKEKIYVDFCHSIKKAIADSEIKDLLIIGKAAEMDWKASAWRLERRFPTKWARREKLDLDAAVKTETVNREELLVEQRITSDPTSAELLKQLYRRQSALD